MMQNVLVGMPLSNVAFKYHNELMSNTVFAYDSGIAVDPEKAFTSVKEMV